MPTSGTGASGNIQGPFTDGTGTYYLVGGQKSYQSPYVGQQGQTAPQGQPGASLFQNAGTWNTDTGQWDQGANWGNILSMVVAGTLTAGAATALMGGGDAATAAANAAAAQAVPSAVPGAVAGIPTALPGAVSAIPSLAGSTAATTAGGLSAAQGLSAAKTGAGVAQTVKSLTGGGNGVATPTTGGSSAAQLAPLLALLPLITTALNQPQPPNPGALLNTIPGGTALANQMANQSAQSAPLRQAVTQEAMNMLPNSAFPGGRPAIPAAVNYPAGTATGGSSSSALPTALLSLAGGLGGGLALAPWLKNLFGGGGGGGTSPFQSLINQNPSLNQAQPNNANFPWQGPTQPSTTPAWSGPINQTTPDPTGGMPTDTTGTGLDYLNTSMGF